eukprot:evm.model.scf_3488EXC.2 EVM.evm.TU.scf_3488EXC.2   scf_3488EXC:8988-12604(-)
MLPTRVCNKQSNLTLGNPDEWDAEYPNKQVSVPTGAFTMYYKIDEEAEEIEVAIKATTDNYVAVGMRAASSRGVPPPRSGPTGAPATSEGAAPASEGAASEGAATTSAPASEGEPTPEAEGGDTEKKEGEGYEMEGEKKEGYETEGESEGEGVSEGTAEGAPVASEGAPVASEGAPVASEGAASEGAASEGEGAPTGVCGVGNATIALMDDFVLLFPEEKETNKTGNKTGNGRRLLFSMPRLEAEAEELLAMPRRMSPGRHLAEDGAEAEQFPSDPTKPVLTYFGPPGCHNPLVDNPSAHPMINQDIVVGYARGEAFRIQDSFTPSRARPLPDVYFGGQDDILDAVGKEENGTTYLKYRRALQTDDMDGDFCIVRNTIYLMIYAYGQPADVYTHIPDSSLETGRASNKAFYGRDELKFHGGGIGASYEGRGVFGQVDFFAEPTADGEGGCAPSALDGYDCSLEVIPGQYVLNWRLEEDGVALAAEATGTGYVALAWPSQAGQMVGAEAVIGWTDDDGEGVVEMYDLNDKSVDAVVATNGSFEIADASVEEADGKTVLRFTRRFDDVFTAAGAIDLLAAFSSDSDALAYHTARQGFAVSFSGDATEGAEEEGEAVQGQVASDTVANVGTGESSVNSTLRGSENGGCLISSLEGYDCMLAALEPAFYIHWAVDGDTLRMAGEAQGSGYCSVAFPSTPGQMIGSQAVIGWAGADEQVGVYALTSQATPGIVPSTELAIFDESVEEVDGKTIVRFSTAFDDNLVPDAENPLLVAFHPETDGIAYHGAATRRAITVNFASGASAVEAVEDLSSYWKAHGILMTIGWGILIPVGIIAARTMKDKAPVWFYVHVVGNTLGLILAAVGFGMAIVKFDREDSFRHRQVGIAAMVIGLFQPLNAFVRPHPGAPWREQWEYVHWTLGRVAVGLAVWNIFTGLDEYEFLAEVGSKKYHVMYGLLLACLFVVYLAAEARAQRIASRKRDYELNQRVLVLEKHTATSAGIQMEYKEA